MSSSNSTSSEGTVNKQLGNVEKEVEDQKKLDDIEPEQEYEKDDKTKNHGKFLSISLYLVSLVTYLLIATNKR